LKQIYLIFEFFLNSRSTGAHEPKTLFAQLLSSMIQKTPRPAASCVTSPLPHPHAAIRPDLYARHNARCCPRTYGTRRTAGSTAASAPSTCKERWGRNKSGDSSPRAQIQPAKRSQLVTRPNQWRASHKHRGKPMLSRHKSARLWTMPVVIDNALLSACFFQHKKVMVLLERFFCMSE
jgi:hypothetical protein